MTPILSVPRLAKLFTLFVILVVTNAWADQSPVDILGHLPSIENVAISPDGSRLAMIRTQGDKRYLVLVSLVDGKVIGSHEVAGAKLRHLDWADNSNLLITVSNFSHTRGTVGGHLSEQWVLTSLNVDKTRLVNPLNNIPEAESRQHQLDVSNQIIDNPVVRNIKDDTLVYVAGLSTGLETQDASGAMFLMPSLLKFKAGVNITSLVDRSKEFGTEWLIDEKGHQFVDDNYSEDDQKWTLRLLIDGKWKDILSESFSIERPSVAGTTADGTSLLVKYFDKTTARSAWMSVSLQDGKITRPVPALEKYQEFVGSVYSPRLIGAYRSKDQSLEFFDSQLREAWDVILNQFTGEFVEFETLSQDQKKIVVKVEGVRDGYSLWLFDTEKFKFTSLGAVYGGLTKLAETQRIDYEARDQLKLEAFVTYPQGERKNLPTVVIPHGGPAAHDDGHFDDWAQAFASQGYLVIQPNFRGSDTTADLREAGFGEWGRKMQTDIDDALSKLVKDGKADPKRVCIVGGSYGGYAALAGATTGNGIYRCAISFAGIGDLGEFRQFLVSSLENRNSVYTRYFDRFLGVSNSKDQALQVLSPVSHVANVDIPVLLIHGTDDSVVPYRQSEIMFNALKKANKNVELVRLEGEDHHLSNSNTRSQALQAMVGFLLKYNPPDTGTR